MFWQVDLAVLKNFEIAERAKLQFRSEFFNILNHANFLPPSSNCSTLDARGACTDARAGVRRVDPADRDHGRRDRVADPRKLVEPERGIGVVLRRRLPDRSDSEVVRVRLEGRGRQADWCDGEWLDDCEYALLSEEWHGRPSPPSQANVIGRPRARCASSTNSRSS